MDSFSVEAPSYRDFTAGSSQEDVDYFGIADEESFVIKDEPVSPIEYQTPGEFFDYNPRRRSRSVGNLLSETSTSSIFTSRNLLNNVTISESSESLNENRNRRIKSKENIHGTRDKQSRNTKYQSMAEQIRRFQTKTPTRFHTVSSKAEAVTVLREMNSNKFVKPKTPNLLARRRNRPVNNILTAEQREEQEYLEALKNKPKRREFNRDNLVKASSLPNVQRIPNTKIEPFKITEPKKKVIVEEKPAPFKAKPLPVHILQGPVGIKEKKFIKPTEPKTPNIKMPQKKIMRVRSTSESSDTTKPSRPGNTQMMPFSFDKRDQKNLERKEKFIQQFIEKEKAKLNTYHARPMPKFETPKKLTVSSKPVVQAKTPNFASKKLREEAERKFKLKLEMEEQEAKLKAQFKALPAKVLHKKPFEPQHNHHENFQKTQEFKLSSEERAKARKAFDEQIKLKEQQLLELQEREKAEQRRKEEEEIKQMRKTLVMKAQPIKCFKAFEIKPSEKILTNPSTPRLGKTREKHSEYHGERSDNI